ncbi:DNA polymerase [Planctomycetales bacterium]|nr:DNA polymerase [Planctomycetales bacterium]
MCNKEEQFKNLIKNVQKCSHNCPRMCGRKRVFSESNGNINTKVLFIAEAPSRLGAGKTGIPLCGEDAGRNFEELLCSIKWIKTPLGEKRISWDGENIFVTNAVLCNPLKDKTKIAPPNAIEIKNCSDHLKETISIVNPEVIVTLGRKALDALKKIEVHHIKLKDNVATLITWHQRKVFPLYHPSKQVMIHFKQRTEIEQREDYKKLQELVDPIKGLKKRG